MVGKRLPMVHAVRIVGRRRWSCESNPNSGIEEMFVTNRKVCGFLWWSLGRRFICRFGVVDRRCVVRLLDAGGSAFVLPIRSAFCSFRKVPLGEVREVDRFDVEGFVAL